MPPGTDTHAVKQRKRGGSQDSGHDTEALSTLNSTRHDVVWLLHFRRLPRCVSLSLVAMPNHSLAAHASRFYFTPEQRVRLFQPEAGQLSNIDRNYFTLPPNFNLDMARASVSGLPKPKICSCGWKFKT
jgi:hypothetical protein